MPVALQTDAVASLLAQAGLPERFELVSLPGGGNNRVYRVGFAGGAALLKAYFRHPDDQRDRLAAEFGFSRFAWTRGLRRLPQPLACDPDHSLGLYEFIVGRGLTAADVGADEVDQAIAFYRELNAHRAHPAAAALPAGSEACFTIAQHLQCVERRLLRLREIPTAESVDREARELVDDDLLSAWTSVHNRVLAAAVAAGLGLDTPLDVSQRRLSPSDFGFHNAIAPPVGPIRFIDFEYAGWDDPAKTACDFACQPAVPTPPPLAESFAAAVADELPDPVASRRRIDMLLPVYRIKWCAIMLNEFLPVGGQRRSFARETGDPQERKLAQLEKVRAALKNIPA